jgi:cytochrome P450
MTTTATRSQPAAPGCPFSDRARRFDPFGPDYQTDPAEALRWSREGEPVFFSEVLNYWVVSRYDDIKAIFRDNITFSPAIALEKITPPTDASLAVLRRYDFNLQRTLVNEDEPVHMERRRALLDAFAPEALEAHAPMVRDLVRERVDAIIDTGEADLVAALLWEVPLTVALHFLGVPEEDMEKLRAFSAAHTLNTWGRPTPEEQLQIAEQVGRFWRYSGEVLERMQANPDGHGWMYDMIRRNREMPEVVTDNYLHSMMMAIIVAAHETTALAAANAFRQLLSRPAAWRELCENPGLIPNAVEECLRHSGSVVAWRRIATRDAEVGGVTIPKGGRILMVTASANHDPRHFENPGDIDIYRDNTAEHLTFGYGSHQCMGKNLGRMELRIILEEFTRRLPHLELVPDQEFTFLPNTSFRGPERVLVRWDPGRNPERRDPGIRAAEREFPVGAPDVKTVARRLTVARLTREAEGVLGIELRAPAGRALPRWSPGSHLDLILPDGEVRKYSLCGAAEGEGWQLAVLDEPGRARRLALAAHAAERGREPARARATQPFPAERGGTRASADRRRHRHHPDHCHGRPAARPRQALRPALCRPQPLGDGLCRAAGTRSRRQPASLSEGRGPAHGLRRTPGGGTGERAGLRLRTRTDARRAGGAGRAARACSPDGRAFRRRCGQPARPGSRNRVRGRAGRFRPDADCARRPDASAGPARAWDRPGQRLRGRALRLVRGRGRRGRCRSP